MDKKNIIEKAKKIKLVILDVDGVLTDGGILLDNNGNESKRFHVRDGHGIKMLNRTVIKTAIITGRTSEVVRKRAEELGITEVHQGIFKKITVLDELLKKYKINYGNVAYMGDDIVDIEILQKVGLSAAPSDAEAEAKECADFVTARGGGRGAAREFIDLILKSAGLWDKLLEDSFA